MAHLQVFIKEDPQNKKSLPEIDQKDFKSGWYRKRSGRPHSSGKKF